MNSGTPARHIEPSATLMTPTMALSTASSQEIEDSVRRDSADLCVLACGARKADRPRTAAELYIGSYTRLCLRAARTLVPDSDIRILSARFGLLRLDTVIPPYDTRLGTVGAITADRLHTQAASEGLLDRAVTILAPKAYTTLAQQIWPDARTPLAGARGIGEQQHRLATIIRQTTPPGTAPRPHWHPKPSSRRGADGRIHALPGYRIHVEPMRRHFPDARRLCDELTCDACVHTCTCFACSGWCRCDTPPQPTVYTLSTTDPAAAT
ncbi:MULTISPECIES: YaaA family protein [unclassified Nocardia]|uniref:YaaA family protein n=1 Tax=unclassified Nocardia TaxID=2637762 RepID=UPI001CE42FF2|nr:MULTISPECIES: YaaA family protein [unclassified Nocardia]